MHRFHDNFFSLLAEFLRSAESILPVFVQAEAHNKKQGLEPLAHLHEGWELKIVFQGVLRCPLQDGVEKAVGPAVILVPPQQVHLASLPRDLSSSALMASFGGTADQPFFVMHSRQNTYKSPATFLSLSSDILNRWQQRIGCSWSNLLDGLLLPQGDGADWGGTEDPEYLMYRAATVRFLLAALCVTQKEFEREGAPVSGIVERAIAWMQNHYYDPTLSVRKIAQAVRRSPTYLASLFQQERQCAPRQVLVQIRLEQAHKLLAFRRYSVKEVAHLTGWRSPQYFANCFRKHYGFPPSSV